MRKIYFAILFINLTLSLWAKKEDNAAINIVKGKATIAVSSLDNPQNLDGEWEFYWSEIFNPQDFSSKNIPTKHYFNFPQTWNDKTVGNLLLSGHGYATYRLLIEFDEIPPLLALSIPDFFTSYQLWVNGEVLAKAGRLGTGKSSAKPHWLPDSKPFSINSTQLEIILQIANFHHRKGGAGEPILIGTSDTILSLRESEQSLTYILFGSFIICGLFLLGLYLFGKGDRAALFFALFCLTHSYRIIGAENYVLHHVAPWLPWWFTTKLEYLSLFLSAYYMWKYVDALYPSNIPKILITGIKWLTISISLFIVITPANIYTYSFYIYVPFILFSAVYNGFIVLQNFFRNWKGNLYSTIGFSFLAFVMVLGIGDNQGWWISNLILFLIGYISFLFLQSFHLSERFAIYYKRAVKAADAANQAKSKFLATMSHEIRTPMNGVVGMTNLLSNTNLSEEQKQYINLIKTSNNNLLNIINDILDLSKIEAGQMHLEHQPFELFPAVQNIISLCAPKAEVKNLELTYRIDPEAPKVVIGDINRLRQVLNNLLYNAIKFTEQGRINLLVSLEQRAKNATTLQFQISDTGIGITEGELKRIFAPFTQANNTISGAFGGTGLGLSISKKLVELMGGQIKVHSRPGIGTTFSFFLPVQEGSLSSSKQVFNDIKQNKIAENYPLRILIVEDNQVNQKLVSILLQKQGYKCDIANNGKEAIEVFNRGNYDLIFMDLQMPIVNGLKATEQILKKAIPNKPPIIIAMTANVLDGEREKCLAIGMSDYIGKPIQSGEIENMVLKWGKEITNTEIN